MNIQGEKLSANAEYTESFKNYLQNFILEENYSNDCISSMPANLDYIAELCRENHLLRVQKLLLPVIKLPKTE